MQSSRPNKAFKTSQPNGYSPLLHTIATITACAVVPLILIGAGVTSKGAGMAFPDWPTSNGSLLNPSGWMQDDHKLWEHGHRLTGWLVGMLAIALAWLSWRKRGWIRAVGLATLLAIIVQGVLGGLRVIEISTELAMLHGIWGQLCFCLACIAALITSRAWSHSMQQVVSAPTAPFFQKLSLVATVCLLVQLVTGAIYRHFGVNWAVAAHLIWAAVVILLLSFTALWALEQYGSVQMLARLGRALVALIATQMFLGGAAFLVVVMGGSWPAWVEWAVPSLHVVAGALLLACMVALTLCSFRVLRSAVQTASTANSAMATPA